MSNNKEVVGQNHIQYGNYYICYPVKMQKMTKKILVLVFYTEKCPTKVIESIQQIVNWINPKNKN